MHFSYSMNLLKTGSPAPLPPTKAYTTLVPKFEKHPLFSDFGRKNTPFSTEIADLDAQ